MSDVTIVIKAQNQAQAAMQAVKGDLEQIGRTAGGLKQQLANAAAEMRNVGMGLTAGVTLPIVGVAAAAINSAAQFEQSLNVMQQVSGATEAQMASMQAQALQLGAETSFSAGEAAAGMLELAKAGLDTDQVMAAIGGTMDLAAAGNLGLAQAAEIAANAVNTFGLDATETVDVANMLAAAANASSVEVTDLAQGISMAGAVFASSGQNIDDLTTALALMGNAGIKGSDAGTSLKTMLMRLSAPTGEAADLMAQLGVSMYNLDGSTRALPDVLADLQAAMYGANAVSVTSSNLTAEQSERMDYLKTTIEKTQRQLADYQSGIAGVAQSENDKVVAVDRLNRVLQAAQAEYTGLAAVGGTTTTVMREMTDETRAAALTTIFGADAIRAVNVLMAEGEEGWAAMAEAVGAQGAATEVANARMSGMAGAIEYIKGSIDSLLIGTALPYLDTMGGIVRQAADAISAFGALDPAVKNAAIAFGAVLAAAGPVLLALSGIATAIGFLLSPIGLVVVGLAALAAAWTMNFGGIQEITASAWSAVQEATTAAWAVIGPVVQQSIDGFASYAASIMDAGMGSVEAQESISLLPAALQPVVTAFDDLGASIQSTWGTVFPQVMEAAQAAWEQLSALLEPALSRLQEAFAQAQVDVGALGPKFDELMAAVQNMWTAVQPVLEAFATFVAGVIAVAAVLGVNLLAQAFSSLGTVVGAVFDQVTLTINTFSALITQTVTLVTALINGDWQTAWTSAQGIVGTFEGFFVGTFENLRTIATTIITAISTAVMDTLTDMGVDTEGVMTGISTWWESAWDGLTEKVQPVIDMVGEFRKALEGFAEWVTGFSIPNPFDGWSMPSLPTLPNPFGGGEPAQNQLGASYYAGGPTWVGEAGRELLIPPRGSQIIPNRTAEKLAGAADRVAVTVQQMIVRDDKDIYALAYQVADILARG